MKNLKMMHVASLIYICSFVVGLRIQLDIPPDVWLDIRPDIGRLTRGYQGVSLEITESRVHS